MRIPSTQTRQGYFWLPSDPTDRLPGTLTIRDGGFIDLDVLGAFKAYHPFGQSTTIDRIVGSVEKHGYVTLDRCFYRNWSLASPGIMKGTFFVHRALLGVGHDTNESVVLKEFRFSVDGFEDWLGMTGLHTAADLTKGTATITCTPQDEVKVELNNGLQLALGVTHSFPRWASMTGTEIRQAAHLRLVAKELRPIDDFTLLAHRLTNFLCFAMDETVTMRMPSAATMGMKEGGTDLERVDLSVVYQSLPFTEQERKPDAHRMLFRFADIRDNAAVVINKWLGAYETVSPALNLYFSARTGAHRFVDSRFLALAQAAETLHRRTSDDTVMDRTVFETLVDGLLKLCPDAHKEWLRNRLTYGNEPSLANRLKKVIQPFEDLLGTADDRARLVRSAVDTRNYLTHYDPKLAARAAKNDDLYDLSQTLEGILQLRFFREIGFTDMQLRQIVAGNDALCAKLAP